jgi:hypothetical protein
LPFHGINLSLLIIFCNEFSKGQQGRRNSLPLLISRENYGNGKTLGTGFLKTEPCDCSIIAADKN